MFLGVSLRFFTFRVYTLVTSWRYYYGAGMPFKYRLRLALIFNMRVVWLCFYLFVFLCLGAYDGLFFPLSLPEAVPPRCWGSPLPLYLHPLPGVDILPSVENCGSCFGKGSYTLPPSALYFDGERLYIWREKIMPRAVLDPRSLTRVEGDLVLLPEPIKESAERALATFGVDCNYAEIFGVRWRLDGSLVLEIGGIGEHAVGTIAVPFSTDSDLFTLESHLTEDLEISGGGKSCTLKEFRDGRGPCAATVRAALCPGGFV